MEHNQESLKNELRQFALEAKKQDNNPNIKRNPSNVKTRYHKPPKSLSKNHILNQDPTKTPLKRHIKGF